MDNSWDAILELGKPLPCPGPIGVGLWRSPLKGLPDPPWAPRKDFASLSGGKSNTGWRNIWIFGGVNGSSFMNDIWRSVDGGGSWQIVKSERRWSGRSRLGVCGASTPPSKSPTGRPVGIIYVIGGQGVNGYLGDVWASDTAGQSWHRMCERAPFGPRADVACAVVPGDPLKLVVGGGVHLEVNCDLWLSRDAGETFSRVEMSWLPFGMSLIAWPPDLLCAARLKSTSGTLQLWRLSVGPDGSLCHDLERVPEGIEDESEEPYLSNTLPRPVRFTLDLQMQIVLSWHPVERCLVAQHLLPATDSIHIMHDVAAPCPDAHIHCDMDAANHDWEMLRHGRIHVFAGSGSGAWASDRGRYRAQGRFLKVLGLRLQEMHGFPWDLWMRGVPAMLLPGRQREKSEANVPSLAANKALGA